MEMRMMTGEKIFDRESSTDTSGIGFVRRSGKGECVAAAAVADFGECGSKCI